MCDNLGRNLKNDFMELEEFIKHFNIHYSLLMKRYERFCQINKVPIADIDVITYLDIIVVQLRAICIENAKLKRNYTAQILLKKVGQDELANRVDKMLDTEFLVGCEGYPIRKALKDLADGFICHYDNFDEAKSDGWIMAEIIEKQLRNPYDKHNLNFIMKTLIDCIGDGLTLKL